ncbi:MAG TPA: hypothetical protein ENH37_08820 [Deltaproteobacteria bacterium]|nr:hypothetical protein [Deltaproteobacteria bacterium]
MQRSCSNSFRPMVLDRQTGTCPGSERAKGGWTASGSVLLFFLLLAGCASLGNQQSQGPTGITGPDLSIYAPCTLDQARKWASSAGEKGSLTLRAANCYAFLARQGEDRSLRLARAVEGRRLAETAKALLPKSGQAHYLYAYLTGLEAENNSLRGLELVPVIEREALLAADLDPGVDHGGPHRMLGELYLRAPPFPLSIGDPARAVEHYRQAVEQAPGFMENRLGLVEGLLADEQTGQACVELRKVLIEIPPESKLLSLWKRALELLKRVCDVAETAQ